MRLSDDQARSIVTATRELAGPRAAVRLFGSHLRDHVRDGDVGLLVACPAPVDRPVWLAARITARLQRLLGDRRIDVLVVDPQTPQEPVHRVALAEGVRLEP